MKKFFITAVLAIAVITSGFASDGVKVNKKVQSAFQKEFAAAFNPRWESVGDGLFHVSFTQNSEVMDAYYNEDAELVFLARFVSREQLPILVNRAINERFKDAELTQIRELVSDRETSYLVSAKYDKGTTIARIYTTGGYQIVKKIKNTKG